MKFLSSFISGSGFTVGVVCTIYFLKKITSLHCNVFLNPNFQGKNLSKKYEDNSCKINISTKNKERRKQNSVGSGTDTDTDTKDIY